MHLPLTKGELSKGRRDVAVGGTELAVFTVDEGRIVMKPDISDWSGWALDSCGSLPSRSLLVASVIFGWAGDETGVNTAPPSLLLARAKLCERAN